MKKLINLYILLLLTLSPLWSLGVIEKSEEEAAVPEPETQLTIQELYTAMDPELPVIGFLKPEFEKNISTQDGIRVWNDFLDSLVASGLYKPTAFEKWFVDEYSRNKPRDIIEILYDMKAKKLPLEYMGTMKITRSLDKFSVRIGIYDLQGEAEPLYIYRLIDDLDESWDYIFPDMMNEFAYRMTHPHSSVLNKKIYIEPLRVRYYQYYEISTGEYAFTEIPFIVSENIDFRDDNDIFAELLGIKLHLSGVFPVLFSDFNSKSTKTFRKRPGCAWGIKSELRISDRLSVFRLKIYDYKRQDTIAQYDFPFNGYDTATLCSVVDLAIPFILEKILSETEKQRIAYVLPQIEDEADRIYSDLGYLGPADLVNSYIMETGLNKLLLIQDPLIPLTKEELELWKEEHPEEPAFKKELVIPDLTSFNISVLTDASGNHYKIFKEKDILYAESLFQD